MIRRETGSVLLPYLPGRWHPALRRLEELLAAEPGQGLGRLEQVAIERAIPLEAGKSSVLARFSKDADLARALAGELNKVSALAAAGDESRYARLGVQLSGPRDVLVRWSAGPVETAPGARLIATASGGKASLWMPLEPGRWTLTLTQGPKTVDVPLDDGSWDPAAAGLDALSRAIAGEEVRPNWIDAARGVELTEAIDRSLAKGRTIELYFEDYTEQGTFKGTMTSLGCGLLVSAMVLMFAAAIAARLGVRWAGYWAYFLLAVLLLFLLLQMFRFVFPREDE
jgi:predicted dehydrogenase